MSPLSSPAPLAQSPLATPTPRRLPPCQFGSAPIASEAAGPSLEDYVFSEPKVVLTSTSALGIAGWLPDSERLLITQDAPQGHQLIETFDIRAGKKQIYADRHGVNGKPVWLSGLEAVAYSTIVGERHELWISYGDPGKVERIAPDVEGLSLATDGQRLVYFSPSLGGDQPQLWNASAKTAQSMAIDLAQWKYPKHLETEAYKPVPGHTFQAAWQPAGAQIAFYGYAWLFLVDTKTNQGCEADLAWGELPRSVLYAQWSPNGRYLAMISTAHVPGRLPSFSDLIILDVITGKQYRHDLKATYVGDVAWSPDNQTMAVLRPKEEELKKGYSRLELFFINILDGKLQQFLFPQTFGSAGTGWEINWSPKGNSIAVECPVWPKAGQRWIVEDRICIIDVGVKP
jgi:dipeptidyl aminopeptidase/acylaminoacyl peptidase